MNTSFHPMLLLWTAAIAAMVLLTVAGPPLFPAQAASLRWDYDVDGVFPDGEVPGTDHFTLNGTGIESVAGGVWSLNTSANTNIYNRYAQSLAITDYAEILAQVKVLGPSTDNGLGATFGVLDSSGNRSTFSVNQQGVKVHEGSTTPVPNMGDFHTFRLIYDAKGASGETTLLYDGTSRLRSTSPVSKSPTALNVYFGDASNKGSANMAVDFLEFTNTPPRNLVWSFDVDGVDPRDEEAGTVRSTAGNPTTSTVAGGIYRIDTGANGNTLSFSRRMNIDSDFAQTMVYMKDEGTSGHGGHAGFRFVVDKGSTYARSQFAIRDGQVQINEEGAADVGPTSDHYHLYHLVHDGNASSGQQTRLYKDGILVASGDPQVKTASLSDAFSFGDATGNGQANWSIDWIRATSDAGPMTLPYDHYWEPKALPENSAPAWTFGQNPPSSDFRTLVPGQYLNINTGNGIDDAYHSMYGQPDIVDTTRPLTIDFQMRVNSRSAGSDFVNALTLYVPEGNDTRYYVHSFGPDRVYGPSGTVLLDTSEFHDYRITLDPGAKQTKLYIDDGLELTSSSSGTISNFSRMGFYWGDAANSRAGSADWAFVGWSNLGAFDPALVQLVVPEPGSMGLLLAGVLALLLSRRRNR